MALLARPKPFVTVILDGWGISLVEEGNAIATANTATMDMFAAYYPTAAIAAAGIEVGLPWGEVGNSETGHRNIGAGQVQYQPLPLIDRQIEEGTFFANRVFLQAVAHVKQHRSNLHLMGLVSPGGVHSHMNHLFALLQLAAREQLAEHVFVHMFTDGRDSPPQSALTYLQALEDAIGKAGIGKIASVMGRLYAMDRNKNWDRTEAAYNALIGKAWPKGAPTAQRAIEQAYEANQFDEMIEPTVITHGGQAVASIRDNDAVIFFNYRPDRARQITEAFTFPTFSGFERQPVNNVFFVTMTQYDKEYTNPVAYKDEALPNPLAKIISDAGLTQLHLAETEKYAHITYYLNCGNEQPFPGEQHVLIQSASVKNFAHQPLMGAGEITDRLLAEVQQGTFDTYFVNFANPDMVGHTGDFDATVKGCEFVDTCLKRIYDALLAAGGAMLVTADHGNAEEKIHHQTHQMQTDHTTNPVPLHFVHEQLKRTTPRSQDELLTLYSSPIGVLADVAPTILEILGIEKHPDMTGISLLASLQ